MDGADDVDEELDEPAGRKDVKPVKDNDKSSDGDSDFERSNRGSKRKAQGSGEHPSTSIANSHLEQLPRLSICCNGNHLTT
jgi:hypothetical protein